MMLSNDERATLHAAHVLVFHVVTLAGQCGPDALATVADAMQRDADRAVMPDVRKARYIMAAALRSYAAHKAESECID